MSDRFWLAANSDETEWYVMKGVEIHSGPHDSRDACFESLSLEGYRVSGEEGR